MWNVTEGKQILLLKDHKEAIYSATWSPDGNHLLTGGSDGKIILWDANSGRNEKVKPGPERKPAQLTELKSSATVFHLRSLSAHSVLSCPL